MDGYDERNKVVIALGLLLKTVFGLNVYLADHPKDDTSWDPEWLTILVIELPFTKDKQISWHLDLTNAAFASRFFEVNADYVWDGHTTAEKYLRLFDYVERRYR